MPRVKLVPETEPATVVILDNLAAHRSKEAERALREHGCWFPYLQYSPDLNPIERAYAKRTFARSARRPSQTNSTPSGPLRTPRPKGMLELLQGRRIRPRLKPKCFKDMVQTSLVAEPSITDRLGDSAGEFRGAKALSLPSRRGDRVAGGRRPITSTLAARRSRVDGQARGLWQMRRPFRLAQHCDLKRSERSAGDGAVGDDSKRGQAGKHG